MRKSTAVNPNSSDEPETRTDGESWESYARRLEVRVKEQRDQLESLNRYRETHTNRADRKKISSLMVALGRMTERWEHERTCRMALVAEKSATPVYAEARRAREDAGYDDGPSPAVPVERGEADA